MERIGILDSFLSVFGRSGASIISGCDTFDTEEYISLIYDNPSFTIAEQKKINAIKTVEWGIFKDTKDGNVERINNHILEKMFEMPNKNITWGDFLAYWIVWLDGKDNGVLIQKIEGARGFRPDLRIWNPDNFQIYMNNMEIDRIQTLNPSKTIIGEELKNYMWVTSPNYLNDVAGASYMSAQTGRSFQRGMALVGSFVYNAFNWNNSLQKNQGKSSGVYTSDQRLTPDEIKRLEQKINERNGMKRKGQDLLINAGMKYTPTGTSIEDSDWNNGETKAHDRLVSSLGVAPELTGSGNSTFENRKEARKELYHETIIPFCKDTASRLNYLLKDNLKKGEYIWFKTDSIPALKVDISEAIKALSDVKDRVTINEYRAMLSELTGKELRAISDVLLVQSSNIPLEDLIATETQPSEDK